MPDHSVALDDDGREVLVGLTFEETAEYLRLADIISSQLASMDSRSWSGDDELRWLALAAKHEAALKPFFEIGRLAN